MHLSDTHRALLRALQKDGAAAIETLASAANVSQSTVWRRLKELEQAGIILNKTVLVDPKAAGLAVSAFFFVNLRSHSKEDRKAFETLLDNTPEIMQCHSITGPHDYLVMVRTKDIEAYEDLLMNTILSHPSVSAASSHMALREKKFTVALPL